MGEESEESAESSSDEAVQVDSAPKLLVPPGDDREPSKPKPA